MDYKKTNAPATTRNTVMLLSIHLVKTMILLAQ